METLANRPRRYEDAARAIRDYIVEHQLRPGDMLPSERQIQQQLGISRASVREALRVLQNMGLVEARHGKGLFVKQVDFTPLIDAYIDSLGQIDESFLHLLQIREVLELGAAKIAARERTPDELAALAAVLAAMRQRIELGETALGEDLEFHNQLVRVAHNPLLDRLYSAITPFLLAVRERATDGGSRAADWQRAYQAHAAIFQAVSEQDAARAVGLMQDHLATVRQDLLSAAEADGRTSRAGHPAGPET
ncbi:MAG: FadR/GntR family transcriptional regulator [Thermomicrobiales bacterium]